MKLTNRLNLPDPIVKAVSSYERTNRDYDLSVTQLLKPMRMVVLEQKHRDEIVEDVADRIWALIGQVGHTIIEQADVNEITEERFYKTIQGLSISGKMDLIGSVAGDKVAFDTIVDYKFTSAWSLLEGVKPEWVQQLNSYAYLAEVNGLTVKNLKIVAIYRDWSIMEAKRNRQYPQEQIQVFDVPLWRFEERGEFLFGRVSEYLKAKAELPLCTSEERWEKPTVYALMKEGRKRAVKLYDDPEEAMVAMRGAGPKHRVDTRPGASVRCQFYCSVSDHCDWWKANKPVEDEEEDKPNGT